MPFYDKKEKEASLPELNATDCLRFSSSLFLLKGPSASVHSSLYQLEDTTFLQGEDSFAKVWGGWCQEGLRFYFSIDKPVEKVSYPEIRSSDSIELFIDTRDVKTSGFNTKFCHHFYFLPEKVDGRQAAEITRFRTEDSHLLCDHQELKVSVKTGKNSYAVDLFIPEHCLTGYDPLHFKRIGFCYRINTPQQESMHYAISSKTYKIEENPSLWSTFFLKSTEE